jgi:hypothetical protein
VLLEGRVKNPVQGVLDLPVAAHGLCERLRRERAGGDVGTALDRDRAFALDARLDHGNDARHAVVEVREWRGKSRCASPPSTMSS